MARPPCGLCGDVPRHIDLPFMLLGRVGVAAIDHQGRRQLGLHQVCAGGGHVGRVVIGGFAATQDDMAVLVAIGLHNCHLAVFVHRQKVVPTRSGLNCIGSNFDVAIGAVLETNRRRQPRGQFAVHLAFSGARTNRAPGNQVAQVLR